MSCVYAAFRSLRDGTNPAIWLLPILHNTWIGGHRNKRRRDVRRITERDGPHRRLALDPEDAASAFAVDIVHFRRR